MKVKISNIKPNPNNPRTIKDERFAKLVKSLQDFPEMLEKRPLICFTDTDGKFVVLGGNQRLKAAKEAGMKELPILLADDWTPEQQREFVIKDNGNWYGEWDWEMLETEWDADELIEWGLEMPEGDEPFGSETVEAKEDDFDTTPPAVAKTVLWDLYEIGSHRLVCGDATCSDTVAKLMDGEKADMVFTDPPYGNGTSGKYGRSQLGHRTIENDEDFSCVDAFFNLRMCDRYVFFLQWRTFDDAFQTLQNNDLKLKTIAVWDKKNAGLGSGMAEQWEAILIAGDVKYSKFGGNVFTVSREQKKREDSPHPHQKPIELLAQILDFLEGYNLLFDPFLGSGSTMVAAHQLKRKCYGMEIDPKYCDVIVKRMLSLDNTLKVKRNGIDVTDEWRQEAVLTKLDASNN